MGGEDLNACSHIVAELPQPWPMTLVDVKLWILKLFWLHPETQDLHITGFFQRILLRHDLQFIHGRRS